MPVERGERSGTVSRDGQSRADLAHPAVTEPAQAAHQSPDGQIGHGVELHDARSVDRIVGGGLGGADGIGQDAHLGVEAPRGEDDRDR